MRWLPVRGVRVLPTRGRPALNYVRVFASTNKQLLRQADHVCIVHLAIMLWRRMETII